MLLEQTEAIQTNMSKIARMKTRAGLVSHPNEYAPVATEFNEVFGGDHPSLSLHWLLPLPIKFPEWALDNILGYEYDITFDAVPYQEPAEESGTDADSTASGLSSMGGGAGALSDAEGDLESGLEGGSSHALEQELLPPEGGNEISREIPSSNKLDSSVKKRSSGL